MKTLISFYFVCLFYTLGFAHNPNEAFFIYTEKENTVEVKAEFPWAIRNALIKFNPELVHSNSQKDFEEAFSQYISQNLILKDNNGKPLQFQRFYGLENEGHTHQNDFLFIFKGKDVVEITNTIMFNLYDHQVNYNSINLNQKATVFKTTPNTTHFKLKESTTTTYWLYLLVLLIPMVFIFFKYVKKT